MSVKSFNTILSLIILISSSFLYTKQNPESIDSWRFIEYNLITKPNSLNKKANILRLLPAYLGGAAFGIITKPANLLNNFIRDTYGEFSEKERNYTIGITSILGASLIYGIVDTIIQHEVDLQMIHAFIIQWPKNKKYTPKQLHTIFNDVYDMYLFDPYSYKYYHNALDALVIARNNIYYQFPKTYGHIYKRTGITNRSKRLVFKLLNFAPIKMILNTIKLFV